MNKNKKTRLDLLLVQHALFPSREQAQRAIMAGEVFLEDQRADKPGARVSAETPLTSIRVRARERYVGRGGRKLEAALRHFQIDPTGRRSLDIGASTGGFTDCLLQHGAAHVIALDVGHGQLDWKIRSDPRVTVIEKCNARTLEPAMLAADPEALPELCVIDVSFISLTLILPAAFACLRPGSERATVIALIKPQFELGKEEVDPGRGVVRDPEAQRRAVEKIEHFTKTLNKRWCGVLESPILGGDGNREFLACLHP